jgi:hypothetical protein
MQIFRDLNSEPDEALYRSRGVSLWTSVVAGVVSSLSKLFCGKCRRSAWKITVYSPRNSKERAEQEEGLPVLRRAVRFVPI